MNLRFTLSILSIFLFFIQFAWGQACPDMCKTGLRGARDVVRVNILKEIHSKDSKKIIAAYEQVEDVSTNEGIEYLNRLHIGTGCFYYYYAYASLTAVAKRNESFSQYLDNKSVNIEQLTRNAYIAIEYAEEILVKYQSEPCPRFLNKIGGKNGALIRKYQGKLGDIRRLLSSGPVIDIAVNHCTLRPQGSGVTANIEIENRGAFDIESAIPIEWKILNTNISERKEIMGLPKGETYSISFYTELIPTKDLNGEAYIPHITGESIRTNNSIGCRLIQPQREKNNQLLSIRSNNDRISPPTKRPKGGTDNCIEINHDFNVGDLENQNSSSLNSLFFKDVLPQHISPETFDTVQIKIIIIGYADARQIGNQGVENKDLEIKNAPYYSLDNQKWKEMNLSSSKIRTNEQLAFIRAYLVKQEILKHFNIDPNLIEIHTNTSTSNTSQEYRKAQVLICDPLIDNALQEDMEDTINDHLALPDEVIVSNQNTTDNYQQFDFKDAKIGQTLTIKNLLFDTNSIVISPTYFPILDNLSEELMNNTNISIEIRGHTNTTCDDEYCEELSLNRAKAVRDYIVSKGIVQNRVTYDGYGKTEPLTRKEGDNYQSRNQRVEIKFSRV